MIPAIGLTAPVEEGTDDAELNVAVGHVPSSVWPGKTGNTVLEAHDVSYFVNIDQLKPGDTIATRPPAPPTTTPSRATRSSSRVPPSTTPRAPPSAWSPAGPPMRSGSPPPAIWSRRPRSRPPRTRRRPRRRPGGRRPGLGLAPDRPGPAALVAQGLTLATNSILMGTMSVSGRPDPRLRRGSRPPGRPELGRRVLHRRRQGPRARTSSAGGTPSPPAWPSPPPWSAPRCRPTTPAWTSPSRATGYRPPPPSTSPTRPPSPAGPAPGRYARHRGPDGHQRPTPHHQLDPPSSPRSSEFPG